MTVPAAASVLLSPCIADPFPPDFCMLPFHPHASLSSSCFPLILMLPSHPYAFFLSSCFLLVLRKLPEAPAPFRKIITAAIPPCNTSAKSPIASAGMEASHRFAEAADAALFRVPAVRFVGAFLQLYSPSAPSRFHAEWPQGRSFKVFTASRNGIKNY